MASAGASLRGDLTVYKNDPTLVMFTSGPDVRDSEGTVVFVGGLTDGPMGLAYLPALAAALEAKRWRLCQPTLSSSYLGFGVSDLDKDVEELDLVLDRILASANRDATRKKDENENAHAVALVGHSTGCQDIVHFLKRGRHKDAITAAVLQAPVSDREAMCMEHGSEAIEAAHDAARLMMESGDGDSLMPRSTPGVFGAPVTAARYFSLSGRMTLDDMFSSDLTESEFLEKIGHMGLPSAPKSLWVRSADDESTRRVPNAKAARRDSTRSTRINAATPPTPAARSRRRLKTRYVAVLRETRNRERYSRYSRSRSTEPRRPRITRWTDAETGSRRKSRRS
jgi:hypothetical protein